MYTYLFFVDAGDRNRRPPTIAEAAAAGDAVTPIKHATDLCTTNGAQTMIIAAIGANTDRPASQPTTD